MTLDRIELHLHLEGAAPPAFIAGLAAEKGIDLTGVFDADGSYAFGSFAHFLEIYEAATSVLKTPEDYRRLTRVVLEEQAAHGILYTEAFLSPAFCGGDDLSAWTEYLAAIREAADEAEAQDGVILRGIVTAVRHFGPERARASAACAQETAGDWLVGFGMGGNERVGRTGEYTYAFDMAREAGLRLTSHAGEWDGPESVADTLDHLRVERLGHGVRAVEDDALVDRLAEAGTVLEVCPGSNIALGLYPDWRAHPIERLRTRGVKVTVSTDDPPFFHTTMSKEYECLAEAFDWDDAEFRTLNRVAAEAAFCDETTRARLIEALEPKDA
ncbi:MAG: adenosine deaminase [Pseudomonadota bacterium]